MQKSEISLTPFEKALASLQDAIKQPKNQYIRDAVIQRFEYTYELAWKMLKRYLSLFAGIEEGSIKNLYRQAAKIGVLDNLENWFEYHTARNLTSHTYNELVAEETYLAAKKFAIDADRLLENLTHAIAHDSE